jgi:hypothetical protein
VRETFEETGLLLAESGDIGSVAHPEWAQWKARGLAPGLHRLVYFGRAITSPICSLLKNSLFRQKNSLFHCTGNSGTWIPC